MVDEPSFGDSEDTGAARARSPVVPGRLLVATPGLLDPNFARTVVLVVDHGADGSLGLVLNRPSHAPIDELFADWAAQAAEPAVAFIGGPVAPDSVIALGQAEGTTEREGWVPVLGELGSVDLARPPGSLGVPVSRVRAFAGHAGWSPGQLDAEIDDGGWFVVDGGPDDVFSPCPDDLWRAVLRRQPGRLGWYANCPPDPSVN